MATDEIVYNAYIGFNANWLTFYGWRYSVELAAPGPSLAFGRTNYLGCAGAVGRAKDIHPFYRTWEGMMHVRSQFTLGQITVMDGTSNTLMFGEAVGAFRPNADGTNSGIRERGYAWMGGHAMAAYWGVHPANKDANWYTFGSRHAAGANFVWGDGSVRTIAHNRYTWLSPEWYVLMQLAGVRDGYNDDASGIIIN
jgi:prepilin-type processing-associated H-X9-DG protein